MDNLYRWVDEAAPADKSFSAQRTTRLLGAFLLSSVLSSLPISLLWLGVGEWQRAKTREVERAKLQQQERELIRAAQEGRTGEAFRRLYGVQPRSDSDPSK